MSLSVTALNENHATFYCLSLLVFPLLSGNHELICVHARVKTPQVNDKISRRPGAILPLPYQEVDRGCGDECKAVDTLT